MRVSKNELALRPAGSPNVVYKNAPHETQYVIQHTLLGEAALVWSAQWLAGLFCVMDFPAELAAYVQNVLLGPTLSWKEEEKPLEEALEVVARGGGMFADVAGALLRGHGKLKLLTAPSRDD